MLIENHTATATEAKNGASEAAAPWAAAALTVALTIFAVLFVSFIAVATGLV